MAEHIAAYAYVKSYSGVHLYEHRFSQRDSDSFGTRMSVVIDEANKTAHIIDLKVHGKGVKRDETKHTSNAIRDWVSLMT